MNEPLTFCTIASRRYLPMACAMCHSVKQHNDDAQCYVLLLDIEEADFPPAEGLPFTPLYLRELGITGLENMQIYYDLLEQSDAFRPSLIRHILVRKNKAKVIYLDSDIFVTGCFDDCQRYLARTSFCLTPHLRKPLPIDFLEPSNFSIASYGVYNIGFMAFKNSEPALRILDFLIGESEHHCFYDPEQMVSGQRLYALAAALYHKDLMHLDDAAYNIAYWNLHERKLESRDGRFFTEGKEVVFFHLSGFDLSRSNAFHARGNRFPSLHAAKILGEVVREYARLVRGYEKQLQLAPEKPDHRLTTAERRKFYMTCQRDC